MARRPAVDGLSLEALGLDAHETAAYLCLLDHPRATAAAIADAMGVPARRAQRLLDAIEARGLVTHSPERPRRYLLAAPDIAIEALILKREKELQGIRGSVRQLHERAASHRQSTPQPLIELITQRESERQVFRQLQASAQRELIFLVRPPILISRPAAPEAPEYETDARARGVRYRGIVDSDYLALPGAVEHVRADIDKGDEVRVVHRLPFKMVLADRRTALIPLDLTSPRSEVLLVRSSALLDALYALFESLWDRAVPVSLDRDRSLKTGADVDGVAPEAREILKLMAAGLNDKAIAHELGISMRTLNRRISELMAQVNARSRFQIGWIASRLLGDP
ncbi:MAG TPA: helix-turn-helix domain-containing protein [Rhodanobacteraceae bacterium]|nr:helix-turn-helix domain-containing protein [Rhodanobacteraceae bacterium]